MEIDEPACGEMAGELGLVLPSLVLGVRRR
jgi:hypothetical protein